MSRLPIAAVLRPASDRRVHRRHPVRLDACLDAEGRLFPCVIMDVSAGGAQLVASLPTELEIVRLEIEAFDAFDCRVAWRNDTRVGVEFLHEPEEVTRRLAALLGSG
jgi:hypothetical protein